MFILIKEEIEEVLNIGLYNLLMRGQALPGFALIDHRQICYWSICFLV